jgi:hypothetical protein
MKRLLICFFCLLSLYSIKAQSGSSDFDTLFNADRNRETSISNPILKSNGFKNFLLGKNYRQEWITPITVPVIHLKTDLGGLEIDELGGGKQTHTLHLKDQKDRKIFLRSVAKYPEKAVPAALAHTIAEKILADGISGSYPYAVLSVLPLSQAAGVPYYKNKLTFLDSGSQLGKFKKYGDALYFLELQDVLPGGKKIKTSSTQEMAQKLQESSNNKVDQIAVLRERLLDNFVMDFDRHEGQFDWGKKDSLGMSFFYPMPKDRDQAFFNIEGLIPSIIQKMQAFHQLQGLQPKTKHVATFNFAARNLDRRFLTELNKETWNKEIDRFLQTMTDGVIEKAMSQQPKELQEFRARNIAKILKQKRRYFKDDMIAYYKTLAKRVTILGSNDRERFDVNNYGSDSVSVTVHQLKKDGTQGSQTYHRTFYPGETREIQLYGLEGDDEFVVHGDASSIIIRLVGGPGDDNFISEGDGGSIWVYDVNYEDNTIKGNGMHKRISPDPLNNEYRRLAFNFNSASPGIAVDYSRDGGLYLGLSYSIKSYGFRKEPYASKQYLAVARAINSSSYQMKYRGEFVKLIRNEDLLITGNLELPASRTRFYGYGNNTPNNHSHNEGKYYLASYILGDASLLAQHHFTPWLKMQYGAAGQYLKLSDERNNGKYISSVFPVDEGEKGLASGKWYAGGRANLQINARNSEVFTTRGAFFDVYAQRLQDITAHTGGFTEVGGNASFYSDFLYKKHIVLASNFGAAHNAGSFAFPQAQYLGFRGNLRGFRMQRFAGYAKAYNNTELRVNLGTLNLLLTRGPFGVLGFHDVGRVWAHGETSSTWHRGYGGGLWVAPFNKLVLTGVVTYSKEEKNFVNLNVGFKF